MDKEFLFNYKGKPVYKGDTIINNYRINTGWSVVAYLGSKNSNKYVSVTHPDRGDAETAYSSILHSKNYTGVKKAAFLVYTAGQKIERLDGSCSGIIYLGEATTSKSRQRHVLVEFPCGTPAEGCLAEIRSGVTKRCQSKIRVQPIVGEIRASCGQILSISPEDHALVSQYNIHTSHGFFMYIDDKGKRCKVVNLIMSQYEYVDGWVVSPLDGDHSNARRENLIKETRGDMLTRSRAESFKKPSTGERSIQKTKHNTYQVRVRRVHLGTYGTIEEAIQVRDDYLNNKPIW